MRALVVVLVLARVAVADRLGPRTELGDGHISLRLPDGARIAKDGSASVDEPDGRLVISVARARRDTTTDVRELVAADPDLVCARIERIAVARGAVAYAGVPAIPRRVNDRALVMRVDAVAPDGSLFSARFYIDPRALEHANQWSSRARAIAATLELRPDPPPRKLVGEPAPALLPPDWELRSDIWHTRIRSPHGECTVIDWELGAHASAPDGALPIAGHLHGRVVTWNLWADADGKHAEVLSDAQLSGTLHVTCHAATLGELDRQRHVVEAHLQ